MSNEASDATTPDTGADNPVEPANGASQDDIDAPDPRFCLIEVIVDQEGHAQDYLFLESSPSFDRHAGLNAKGRTAREIIPNLPPEWPEVFLDVARTGTAAQFFRSSEIDGEMLEVKAIPAGSPGSLKVAVTMRVARERKLLEADLQQTRLLLEGIAQGTEDLIAAEDPDFRYTYFNDAYAREFKRLWGQELRVGANMLELLAPWPDEKQKAKELWARALSGESFRVETSFGRTPDEARTYDLRFNTLRDSGSRIIGAAHILRDVTERVRGEQALREADRRKDEFLAVLGHELRNPLASIRHATKLIQQTRGDDPRLAGATATLDRQSAQMTRLVDGLLDISRVVSGRITLNLESLDLGEIARSIVDDRAGQISDAGVVVSLREEEDGTPVRGDPARLTQIVDNLLVNALAFTPRGGRICLELEQADQEAALRIRDTGSGIAPDRLDRIFEPFHQEGADGARVGDGLGLGLSLARELALLHGGALHALSDGPGTGSEFILRLPLAGDVAPHGERPRELQSEPARYRILLVEDQVDAAEMLVLLLEAEGHEASFAETGAAALTALSRQPVQVVLSDIGLPDMSGYDLAREIRGDPRWDEITLIALTGYGQSSDRDRATDAGFDGHLTKPTDVDEIQELIRRLRGRS